MSADVFRLQILMGLLVAIMGGCHSGGDLTSSPPPPPARTTHVNIPTIASPVSSPFYSKDSVLTLEGMCETSNQILLTGDDSQQVSCEDSKFTITVNKSTDGVYSFLVSQMDSVTRSTSSPINFVWIRKTSVALPVITTPAQTTFASAKDELLIEGRCESGALVALAGDGIGYTTCLNSAFSLTLPKSADGDYLIKVNQTDLAGNQAETSMTWQKHAIVLNPGNAFVVVNTSFSFTVTGGSGVYDITLATNNSGGSYNNATHTYTSGTIANSIDVIRVTDSLGSILNFTITTVAGTPDHLTLSSSSNPPAASPGTVLSSPVKVRLVDAYGNGIPSFPLTFKMISGDSTVMGHPLQVTDLEGYAEVGIRFGLAAVLSTLSIGSVTGVLPDLAGSGNATVQVSLTTETKNAGKLGAVYAVGSNPGAMVSADFNGDGYQDVAVLNSGDKTVGILAGAAGGMLGTMVNFATVCDSPNGLAVGDINNDNKQDLAIACGDNNLVILLGAGDGTFLPASLLAAPSTEGTPVDLQLIDWNHDSKLDIVVVAVLGGVVGIWLGDGTGNFTPTLEVTVGNSPNAFAISDINKDGLYDLVVVNSADNEIGLILQVSQNVFAPMVTYVVDASPIAVKVGDLDGDSYPDVVVCNNGSNNLTLWMNDRNGGLQNNSLMPVGASPLGLYVGDLNGDGTTDIAVTNSGEDTLSIIMNRGSGVLETLPVLTVQMNPLGLIGGNFNGDAVTDLVLNSSGQLLQLIPGRATGVGYYAPTAAAPTGLTRGDWNGDGKLDLATIHSGASEVTLLLGQGNGLFASGGSLTNVLNAKALLSGDWNEDGKADLIVALGTAASVRVFIGKGDGTFNDAVDYAVGSGPIGMTSADFNGDGHLDLAVVNQTGNSVSVLLGVGDGTFTAGQNITVAGGPRAIAFGDLNGDKKIDLAVVEESNSQLGLLFGIGDGTFQAVVEQAVGAGPTGVLVQDFNGDGALDVVTLNSSESTVSVILGNGDGSMRGRNEYPCGLNPVGLVSGDFDGNGRLDVAVTNSTDQKATVLLNTGAGALSDQVVLSTKATVGGLTLGDFNNDGSIDLVVSLPNENRVQTWVGL